jgi:hypothetical protein
MDEVQGAVRPERVASQVGMQRLPETVTTAMGRSIREHKRCAIA